VKFAWDARKAKANAKKHGVSFEEAASVFYDPLARIFDDEYHSMLERREIIIGHSIRQNLLIVAFTERLDAIRIVSSGKATLRERKDYEKDAR
jgi:hypothetical protein